MYHTSKILENLYHKILEYSSAIIITLRYRRIKNCSKGIMVEHERNMKFFLISLIGVSPILLFALFLIQISVTITYSCRSANKFILLLQ